MVLKEKGGERIRKREKKEKKLDSDNDREFNIFCARVQCDITKTQIETRKPNTPAAEVKVIVEAPTTTLNPILELMLAPEIVSKPLPERLP